MGNTAYANGNREALEMDPEITKIQKLEASKRYLDSLGMEENQTRILIDTILAGIYADFTNDFWWVFADALMAFQKKYKLNETGIIDAKTLTALENRYESIALDNNWKAEMKRLENLDVLLGLWIQNGKALFELISDINLRAIQGLYNLEQTGLIDANTLEALYKEYPHVFDENLLVKAEVEQTLKRYNENFVIPVQKIQTETQENLSEQETQLTSKNLQSIGKTRTEAISLGKEVLGITEPIDLQKFKQKIIDYQKAHNIWVDGKIGKETYMEMYAVKVLAQANDKIEQFGISPKTQKEIMFVLKNANPKGKNVLQMYGFLGNFRKNNEGNTKYTTFFKEYDAFFNNPAQNPYIPTQEQSQKAMTTTNKAGGTFIWDLTKWSDGELTGEQVWARNKWGIAIVSILWFIFFGNKIPGIKELPLTGKWYERVGMLILGLLGWADEWIEWLWKKVVDGFSRAPEVAEDISNTPAYQQWFEAGSNTIDFVKSKTGFTSEKIQQGYSHFMSNLTSENESYRSSTDPKEKAKYIPNIWVYNDVLWNDTSFRELTIDALEKSKNDVNTLLWYISDEWKEQIRQKTGSQTISETDIKNYVARLLEKKSEKDVYVYDIIGQINTILPNPVELISMTYLEDEKSDNEIKKLIWQINDATIKQEVKKAIWRRIGVQDYGASYNNLQSLLSDKKKHISLGDRAKIWEIQASFLWYKQVEDKINKIQAIKLFDGKTEIESTESLSKKLQKLQSITLPSLATSSAPQEIKDNLEYRFLTAYTAKKKELLTALASKGDQTAKKSLTGLEKQNEALEVINSIENIPEKGASFSEYFDYIEKNKGNYKKALDMLEIQNLDAVTEKYLEKVKGDFVLLLKNLDDKVYDAYEKLEKISTSIAALPKQTWTSVAFFVAMEELSKVQSEYNELEEIINFDTEKAKEYFTFVSPGIFVSTNITSKNKQTIWERFDKIKAKKENIETNLVSVKQELQQSFYSEVNTRGVKVEIKQQTVKNQSGEEVTTGKQEINISGNLPWVVSLIAEKDKVISQFDKNSFTIAGRTFNFPVSISALFGDTEVQRLKSFDTSVAKQEIVEKFVQAIAPLETLGGLQQLENILKVEVIDKLEGVDTESFEDAINNKIFKLFKRDLAWVSNQQEIERIKMQYDVHWTKLTKLIDEYIVSLGAIQDMQNAVDDKQLEVSPKLQETALDLTEKLKDFWVLDFLTKYKNDEIVSLMDDNISETTTLAEIKNSFLQIKAAKSGNAEMIREIDNIIEKIDNYILK